MNDTIRFQMMAHHRAAAKRFQRAAHRLFIKKQDEPSPERRKAITDRIEQHFRDAERHTVFANALRAEK